MDVLSERSDLLFVATTGVLGGFDELKKRPPPKDEYVRRDTGRRQKIWANADMIPAQTTHTIKHTINTIISRDCYDLPEPVLQYH